MERRDGHGEPQRLLDAPLDVQRFTAVLVCRHRERVRETSGGAVDPLIAVGTTSAAGSPPAAARPRCRTGTETRRVGEASQQLPFDRRPAPQVRSRGPLPGRVVFTFNSGRYGQVPEWNPKTQRLRRSALGSLIARESGKHQS